MENAQSLNIATATASYNVKMLAEFKGTELEAGQYLARRIGRGEGKESFGVIVPETTAEEFVAALENNSILEAAVSWFQKQQEECIKARIDAGAKFIVPEDYSNENVVAMLESQAVSEGRISKERLGSWYEQTLQHNLNAAFAAKLGTQWTNEQALAVLGGYKTQFQSLTKKDLFLSPEIAGHLRKAVELSQAGESVIGKFVLTKIEEASKNQVLMGL